MALRSLIYDFPNERFERDSFCDLIVKISNLVREHY
jgi:hypothetical protein